MSTLDVTEEVPAAEEPNITTTVEEVPEEEPASEEVAASETVEESSENDLENRVKELEEKLEIIFKILSYDDNLKKRMNLLL